MAERVVYRDLVVPACTSCTVDFDIREPRLRICGCQHMLYHLSCALEYERYRIADACHLCGQAYINLADYQPVARFGAHEDDEPLDPARQLEPFGEDDDERPAGRLGRFGYGFPAALAIFAIVFGVGCGSRVLYHSYTTMTTDLNQCYRDITDTRKTLWRQEEEAAAARREGRELRHANGD